MSIRNFVFQPYVGALPLKLGMSADEVKAAVGQPKRQGKDRGEYEMSYGDDGFLSLFFDGKEQKLVEMGFAPSDDLALLFEGTDLFRDASAFQTVLNRGGNAFDCIGSIVFPDMGLSFTGFHDDDEEHKAVTVFSRGRWDKLLTDATAYRTASQKGASK